MSYIKTLYYNKDGATNAISNKKRFEPYRRSQNS